MRYPALLAAGLVLAGCVSPLDEVERLSEVDLAETAGTEALVATADAPDVGADLVAAVVGAVAPGDVAEPIPVAAPVPERRGLFDLFRGGGAPAGADDASGTVPVTSGPDSAVVAPGTTLPFGALATVCGVARGDLGQAVATGGGFTLYDSAPGGAGMRTHYLTGFPDACARQFTAAFAVLGDVGTHEIVRYLPGGAESGWSGTDEAYEALKSSFCRVNRGQPCGDAIDRLARVTTFVSVYRSFETNPTWVELLLHDGAVVAMATEGG